MLEKKIVAAVYDKT